MLLQEALQQLCVNSLPPYFIYKDVYPGPGHLFVRRRLGEWLYCVFSGASKYINSQL